MPPASQRLLPVPRPAAAAEADRESPFWRGVKFGVGFMLAVALLLLLLWLVLFWLSAHGWKPWVAQPPP